MRGQLSAPTGEWLVGISAAAYLARPILRGYFKIPLRIGDRNKRKWQRSLTKNSLNSTDASLLIALVEVNLLSPKSSLGLVKIVRRAQGSKI